MNKKFFLILFAASLLVYISSCEKGGTSIPTIAFNTANVYVSADTILYRDTVFNIGIIASKTGPEGYLTSAKITRSVNGGADSTLLDMRFIQQYFIQYYSFRAPDSGVTHRYTATVGNQNEQTNSIHLTVTGK
jgi:hypothetical protein